MNIIEYYRHNRNNHKRKIRNNVLIDYRIEKLIELDNGKYNYYIDELQILPLTNEAFNDIYIELKLMNCNLNLTMNYSIYKTYREALIALKDKFLNSYKFYSYNYVKIQADKYNIKFENNELDYLKEIDSVKRQTKIKELEEIIQRLKNEEDIKVGEI